MWYCVENIQSAEAAAKAAKYQLQSETALKNNLRLEENMMLPRASH